MKYLGYTYAIKLLVYLKSGLNSCICIYEI